MMLTVKSLSVIHGDMEPNTRETKEKSRWYGHKENEYLREAVPINPNFMEMSGYSERDLRETHIKEVWSFAKEKGLVVQKEDGSFEYPEKKNGDPIFTTRALAKERSLSCGPNRRCRRALKKLQEYERQETGGDAAPTAASAFGKSPSASRSTSQPALAGGAVAISALAAALFASGRRHRRGGRA